MNIQDLLCEPTVSPAAVALGPTNPPAVETKTRRNFEEYPRAAALDWELMPHEADEAEEHFQRLQMEQTRLFSNSHHMIDVLESSSDAAVDEPRKYSFTNVDKLEEHLLSRDKALIRHVFIEADDSPSPLNCSVSMLKCVLAYEQVPPAFLKAVYAFGDRPGDLADAGLASFGRHSRTYRGHTEASENVHLSCEWYLVRSFEKRQGDVMHSRDWPWLPRQMAVYHSFNHENGRSFFLTIRGNGLFRKQIQARRSLLASPPVKGPHAQREAALQTALTTHLMYLSWCCRHWGQFIDDVRTMVWEFLIPTRTRPRALDREPEEVGTPGLGAILTKITFRDLQNMNGHADYLRNALLNLTETGRIVRSMTCVPFSWARTPASTGSKASISRFSCELQSFAATIEVAEDQLRALAAELGQGIELHKKGLDLRVWHEQQQLENKGHSILQKSPIKAEDAEPGLASVDDSGS
ncbi:hypothetical protein C8A01DRAFT_40957 [Parachaetomium inaequale]|uniref:CorA-like transporter domain-containing protein n=1 Tax=Parachaetomium inaequale TaxID=2588326 RepID=A0AAN6SMI3_9PEZI|nr:hypothetical protein C8A01DRAFT_40957 [Parachaetomium inaequale]